MRNGIEVLAQIGIDYIRIPLDKQLLWVASWEELAQPGFYTGSAVPKPNLIPPPKAGSRFVAEGSLGKRHCLQVFRPTMQRFSVTLVHLIRPMVVRQPVGGQTLSRGWLRRSPQADVN